MSKLTPTQRQILGHCQDWSAAFEVAERRVNDGYATDWRRTQDVLMSLHKRGLVEYHKGNATYRLTEAGRAALTPAPAPNMKASPSGDLLSGLMKSMDGLDKNQPGYTHAEGWNAALRYAMDIVRAQPSPMTVIDPDQWESCSPEYLDAGGDCHSAPRVWNEAEKNHYHPKLAPKSWRCFHCDQVMHTEEEALLHFGANEVQDPICTISAERVRELELDFERHAAEDSDTDRAMHRMRADHATELVREEEKGFARGLDGGRTERDRLLEVLEKISCRTQTTDLLWWQAAARDIIKEIKGE